TVERGSARHPDRDYTRFRQIASPVAGPSYHRYQRQLAIGQPIFTAQVNQGLSDPVSLSLLDGAGSLDVPALQISDQTRSAQQPDRFSQIGSRKHDRNWHTAAIPTKLDGCLRFL